MMSKRNVYISGQKIILRDWQVQDLDSYAYWQMPDREWQAFDGPYYPRIKVDKIPDMIQKLREKIEADKWERVRKRLPIISPSENRLIGTVSWYWVSQETEWLAVGIGIYEPDEWGRGIGYEALGLWCDYLWAFLPEIVRLDVRTWSGNKGMMRLAEKLGFKEEARFRKARIVNGNYYDGMGYGILREEWQALYPDGFAQR